MPSYLRARVMSWLPLTMTSLPITVNFKLLALSYGPLSSSSLSPSYVAPNDLYPHASASWWTQESPSFVLFLALYLSFLPWVKDVCHAFPKFHLSNFDLPPPPPLSFSFIFVKFCAIPTLKCEFESSLFSS